MSTLSVLMICNGFSLRHYRRENVFRKRTRSLLFFVIVNVKLEVYCNENNFKISVMKRSIKKRKILFALKLSAAFSIIHRELLRRI